MLQTVACKLILLVGNFTNYGGPPAVAVIARQLRSLAHVRQGVTMMCTVDVERNKSMNHVKSFVILRVGYGT